MTFENLRVGLKNSAASIVTETSTADIVGSGSLKVLATPKLIALIEAAASELVEAVLPEEFTSVGISVNIEHTAPTPVGMNFCAEVELIKIDGKKLTFNVAALDEVGEIGRGTHERFIVERENFQAKADKRHRV